MHIVWYYYYNENPLSTYIHGQVSVELDCESVKHLLAVLEWELNMTEVQQDLYVAHFKSLHLNVS